MSEDVNSLAVDVVTSDRNVWSGQSTMVVAPAIDGEVGILPGHSPILAVLGAGRLRIKPMEGETWEATLSGGFLSVDEDVVLVVADSVTQD